MKIRFGFVSNSSSSSFIIAFKDKHVSEVFKQLFKTEDETKEFIEKYYGKINFDNVIRIKVPYDGVEIFKPENLPKMGEGIKVKENFEIIYEV